MYNIKFRNDHKSLPITIIPLDNISGFINKKDHCSRIVNIIIFLILIYSFNENYIQL